MLHDHKVFPTLITQESLEVLAPLPLLLPGESMHDYQTLRHAILAEIAPRSTIEWLLAIDVVELSWEIQRYRNLRHRLLEKSRQRAVANALREIDLVGIATDHQHDAEHQTALNAFAWRMDTDAAMEIEQRLASHGIDNLALNTDVYMQAREFYLMFEGLIISAQHRRVLLLREINHRQNSTRPRRLAARSTRGH
jgi:hypothetical protein